ALALDDADETRSRCSTQSWSSRPSHCAPCARVHAARRAWDWEFATRLEAQACGVGELERTVEESVPWRLLSLAGASAVQQLAAARWSAQRMADTLPRPVSTTRAVHERLRIGYLSGDFFSHPSRRR